jgi:hypothetical protein
MQPNLHSLVESVVKAWDTMQFRANDVPDDQPRVSAQGYLYTIFREGGKSPFRFSL